MADSPAPDYVTVNISSGIFGTAVDVCQRCAAMLPIGQASSPEEQTPRGVHDSFHKDIAGLAAHVALLVHDRAARERYDEEMQERADG